MAKPPDNARSPNAVSRLRAWLLVSIVSVVMILIVAASLAYSQRSGSQIRLSKEKELLTITSLKADAISDWVKERFADALSMSENPMLAYRVKVFLGPDPGSESGEYLSSWMASMVSTYGYRSVILYDASGFPRLKFPEDADTDCPTLRSDALDSIKKRAIVFSDIHFEENGRDIRMAFSAPVIDRNREGFSAVAVISIITDPYKYLYPFVQKWPTPSETAETLLVRRQGDSVIYLNELRHRKGTALRMIMPLSKKGLPAAAAVSGFEGVMEGTDYRGVKVIAAVLKVPGTPWYIVSKIDSSEVYRPIRNMETTVLILALLAIGALAVTAILYHRKAEAEFLGRRYSADLERHVAELAAVNKELDAFSYSVSHDLRTPLRAIDGFSRILEEDHGPKLDGEARRLLGVVRQSAARMNRLIEDLLEFSHVGRQEMSVSEVDMESLARKAYDELRPLMDGRTVAFEVRPMPRASGDSAMLKQVLLNLLSNAIKFTRRSASASIETGCRSEGGDNVYYVKDNGVGFDSSYAGKLFGVFQRLHPQDEFEGTGVGLALVERIVLRHGGKVWAEGRVGVGATIYFSLPKAR